MSRTQTILARAEGRFVGTNLLWVMDPDKPFESNATAQVDDNRIDYTWAYEGKPQTGTMTFALTDEGVEVEWSDTFHTPGPMRFEGTHVPDALVVHGTYGAGEGPDWGWRIEVRTPNADQLLIEMYNIEPSGEEQIAVRMRADRE